MYSHCFTRVLDMNVLMTKSSNCLQCDMLQWGRMICVHFYVMFSFSLIACWLYHTLLEILLKYCLIQVEPCRWSRLWKITCSTKKRVPRNFHPMIASLIFLLPSPLYIAFIKISKPISDSQVYLHLRDVDSIIICKCKNCFALNWNEFTIFISLDGFFFRTLWIYFYHDTFLPCPIMGSK